MSWSRITSTRRTATPVFEGLDDSLGLAKAWHLLAYLDWTRGRLSVAGANAEKARGFARQAGDRYWETAIRGLHCLILYWGSTPLDQVERANRAALAEAQRGGMRGLEASALMVLARIAAVRGDLDEARQLVGAANAIACQRVTAPDQVDAQVKWRSIRAIALARRRDSEETERLAREAVYRQDRPARLPRRGAGGPGGGAAPTRSGKQVRL